MAGLDENLDEDRADQAFASYFERKIAEARVGEAIDLTSVAVYYGFGSEPDRAAAIAREESAYRRSLIEIQPVLDRLRDNGVTVLTGLRAISSDELDGLNRFLDEKEEAARG